MPWPDLPPGFDPVIHARSRSPRGYDFKPRQCDGPCGLIFMPRFEEQTICDDCREPDMGKGADFTPKKKKVCRWCKKPFLPTFGAERYCSEECRLERDRKRWKDKRAKKKRAAAKPDSPAPPQGVAHERCSWAPAKKLDHHDTALLSEMLPAAIELINRTGPDPLIVIRDAGIKITIERDHGHG